MKRTIFFVLILTTTLSMHSYGQKKISGLQIIRNVYNRSEGNNMKSKLTMSLINSRGSKRVRELKRFTKDLGRMEKKIMIFMSPADVRNTAFMTWSYDKSNRDDDQWIYLPALKKIKRISSDSKSDYFMGSDFTYDDLGDRHPSKDRHRLLREETLNGEECYVVESVPREKGYMYSRTITWVIKNKWIDLKKVFYDENNHLLKNLQRKKYRHIKGHWIILESEMQNVQKKHTTNMSLSDVSVDVGISNSMFTERRMRRGL